MQAKSFCLHSSFKNVVTSTACLRSEFQVTPMNLWEIGSNFRCGSLWIASSIINRSVLRLEHTASQPERAWDFKSSGLLRYTCRAANNTNQIKTKWNALLSSLSFPGISFCRIQGKTRLFCMCCLPVSEGFGIPAVRDSLEHRSW